MELSLLEVLRDDQTLSGSQRRAAANLEDDYLNELDDLESSMSTGMAYILAEHLIGLTYVEAMRFPSSNRPLVVPRKS